MEVVVVGPLVEQRVEEDLGCDDALLDGGAVIDANARPRHLALSVKPVGVVAVRLGLEPLPVVPMHLGSVGDDDLAGGQPRLPTQLVDEVLGNALALGGVLAGAQDSERQASGDRGRTYRHAGGGLAATVAGLREPPGEHPSAV